MNPFGPRALAKMYPYPSCHRGLGKGIIIIIIFLAVLMGTFMPLYVYIWQSLRGP